MCRYTSPSPCLYLCRCSQRCCGAVCSAGWVCILLPPAPGDRERGGAKSVSHAHTVGHCYRPLYDVHTRTALPLWCRYAMHTCCHLYLRCYLLRHGCSIYCHIRQSRHTLSDNSIFAEHLHGTYVCLHVCRLLTYIMKCIGMLCVLSMWRARCSAT
jgi:hypothetical protein